MKKIIIAFLILIFSLLNLSVVLAADCTYDPLTNSSITDSLNNCLSGSTLVGSEATIINGDGFKITINNWVKNLSLFLGIGAVLGIVYGAFMLTISAGEDEKVNKAKDIIKWSIIGFLGLITASFIINLLVRVIYSLN
ncbi:MAG: pilin [Candidatus Gracilibacteria bacterium]|nr:pilin [Candidatus Gracilibacteria bacterium]